MKSAFMFILVVFAVVPALLGQDAEPIKVETIRVFVWGQDSSAGAISSTIEDPLTGNAVRKLSYGGVEVSSRLGFERIAAEQSGIFLNYTTTIVNDTPAPISVQYGGISVDGHPAPLLPLNPGALYRDQKRKGEPNAAPLEEMSCFSSGFLSHDHVFSESSASQALTVASHGALTVSTVIRDPRRYHSVLCSVEGCYPTGTVRYYLTVGDRDYVFVWPGRAAVYCGK